MAEIIPQQTLVLPEDEEEDEESYWDYEDCSGSDFDDEEEDFEEHVLQQLDPLNNNYQKEELEDDEEDDDSFDSDHDDMNDDAIIYPDEPIELDGKVDTTIALTEFSLKLSNEETLQQLTPRYKSVSPRPNSSRVLSPKIQSPRSAKSFRPQTPRGESPRVQEQTRLLQTEEGGGEKEVVEEKKEESAKKMIMRCKSHIPSLNGRWDSSQNFQQFCPLTPRGNHEPFRHIREEPGMTSEVRTSSLINSNLNENENGNEIRKEETETDVGLVAKGSSCSLGETGSESGGLFRKVDVPNFGDGNLKKQRSSGSWITDSAFRRRSRPPSIPQVPHYFNLFKRRADSDAPLPKKKKRVFGVPLKIVVKSQPITNELSTDVPNLILEATKFLAPFSATEGLFRVSGTASKVEAFVVAYNKGEPIEFKMEEKDDIYVVATLLKRFFQDLPKPLLTFRLYPRFISAQTNKGVDSGEHRKALEKLVGQLPLPNRRTLQEMLKLLWEVASREESKMSALTLGTCIGQELARKQKLNPATAFQHTKLVQTLIADLITLFPLFDPAVFDK